MDQLNWWAMRLPELRALRVLVVMALMVLALMVAPTAQAGPYEDGLRLLRAKDYLKAATAFRTAAAHGHPAAERELGFLYYKGHGVRQNIPTAVAWFEKSAMRGDVLSQTNLAKMYENGLFVARNDASSAKYFAMAAEQGDRRAQLRMGEMRYLGTGVERDPAEAVKWWILATNDDTKQAQYLRSLVQSSWMKIGVEDKIEGQRRANEWVAAKLTQRGG